MTGWQGRGSSLALGAADGVRRARARAAGAGLDHSPTNPRARASGRPELINDRAAQHIGRTFALAEPIAHGQGRAFIGDTLWQLRGPDLAAGTSVRITGIDGMTLKIEAVETV